MQRHIRRLFKLARLMRRPAYWAGLKLGTAAAIEHEGCFRNLAVGTLVDVGANVGQFSLMARALHPAAIIHAFEPLPGPAARFRALFGADPKVTLHQCAAGEAAGKAVIHVSRRQDSSSLLPISRRQSELFPGTEEASALTIEVARVEDLLDPKDLSAPIVIKLDVQGFELAALKGMPRLMASASHIYLEVSFEELYIDQPLAHEVIAWLADQGYVLAGAHNPSTSSSGAAIQADLLFRNSRRA